MNGAAWDRREEETPAQFTRFRAYLEQPRHERARWLRGQRRARDYAKAHDWLARAAAFDDQQDREHEQLVAEQVAEMRKRHADIGKAVIQYALRHLQRLEPTSVGELVKVLELGARMERMAYHGDLREMSSASRAAMSAVGAPADEWDRLAADLAVTIPR